MVDAQIVVSRTELGLGQLVVSGDRSSKWSCAQGGIGRPELVHRVTYAEPSPHVPGRLKTQAVREQGVLSWPMLIQETSTGLLHAAIKEFEDAISQWSYTVTTTIDGFSETWTCDEGNLTLDGGMRRWERMKNFSEAFLVTLPCYPIAGTV